jgi:hypothetical protein
LFVVENEDDGEKRALVVTFASEPQVFSAMASLVIAAYFSSDTITAGYELSGTGTAHAVEVFVPSQT